MAYDSERHHRRSIRLRGYDYAQAGAYFVTLVTHGRECLFGEVVNDMVFPNDAGRMVQAVWHELPVRFPGVDVDAFVVMPNHIHGIIAWTAPVGAPLVGAQSAAAMATDVGAPGQGATDQGATDQGATDVGATGAGATGQGATTRVAPTLGDVVGAYKSLTTLEYVRGVKTMGWQAFPGRLWQRNYYEHIIRDERALNRIRRYIDENPLRWTFDDENPHRPTS